MDKYDGLALTIGTLWIYIISMPEDLYHSMLERTAITRIVLLLGLGAICFLYGLRDNKLPLFMDTILSLISFAFISSMWGKLFSYAYVLSSRTEVSFWSVITLICFFVGSGAFYGLGGLISKSIHDSKDER